MLKIDDDDDVDILARTIWGEARGESVIGKAAVAMVVMNRLAHPSWWSREPGDGIPDDTVAAVVRDPKQFSCWNPGDHNQSILARVTISDPDFAQCVAIADLAISGVLKDMTSGSTHYHREGVTPQWSVGRQPCYTVGRHWFYKGIK